MDKKIWPSTTFAHFVDRHQTTYSITKKRRDNTDFLIDMLFSLIDKTKNENASKPTH